MIENLELKEIITFNNNCKEFIEIWVEPKFGKCIYNDELIFYRYRNYVCDLISNWFALNETILTPEMDNLELYLIDDLDIITYNCINKSFVFNVDYLISNLNEPYSLSFDDKDFYLDLVKYYNENSPLKMTIKW